MKKLILLMFFITSLLSKDMPSNIVVNECFNDIYYINDMFVLEKDAESHKNKLKETIIQEKYNNDKELMNSVVNFELLYNYSAKEKFGDTFIARLFDKMEANMQTASSTQGNLLSRKRERINGFGLDMVLSSNIYTTA